MSNIVLGIKLSVTKLRKRLIKSAIYDYKSAIDPSDFTEVEMIA
jgi:hypothetical protein